MRLALGTVQFGLPYGIANRGGRVARSTAAAILALAKRGGIDVLDTAIAYGDSEACLGEVGTDDFRVVTKLPAPPETCTDVATWVWEQAQGSLHRLGQSSVYGLLLHRAQQLAGPDGKTLARALHALKDDGLVRKIGVSIYSPAELDAAMPVCRPDLIQAPFNVVDRRLVTSGWLDRLHGEGVEIHVRSAFLQGLLLMPRADVPQKFSPWNDLWDRWHTWLADHRDMSAVQACLAYPLSFKQIDRVVVGVDTAAQLEQLMVAEAVASAIDLPDLACNDERLINPSHWNSLETDA